MIVDDGLVIIGSANISITSALRGVFVTVTASVLYGYCRTLSSPSPGMKKMGVEYTASITDGVGG